MNRSPVKSPLRLTVMRLLLVAVFGLLIFRLWYLQIVEGARFHQAAEVNRRRTLPIVPLRGQIYDRNGTVLAENMPSFSVLAMVEDLPQTSAERTAMLDRLCDLLSCDGRLAITPSALSETNRQQLYLWLAGHMEQPRPQAEEILFSHRQPFSLTLQLGEEDAAWVRRKAEVWSGLSYVNSLQEALQENSGPRYLPVTLMENVPRECALILEENRLHFPGVLVEAQPQRLYPTGSLTAHLVGYVGRIGPEQLAALNPDPESGERVRYLENDRIGQTGAEGAYESLLRGELGIREIQVDAAGQPVGSPLQVQESTPGNDIALTLDIDLQERATEILQHYIEVAEQNRRSYYRPVYSGVALAMDPRNGQILAMVSLPNYDNNAFAGGIDAETFQDLVNDPTRPLLNRAISGEYPPGSTFKLAVAAAGLQEGVITPDTRIYDGGALVVPNRYDASLPPYIFPCWQPGGHGWLDVVQAIQHSCNVYFFTVAGGTPDNEYEDALGLDRLVEYAQSFGYSQTTGLGFPGEADGLIPTPAWKEQALGETWVHGDLYNMGIGQGNILVTPLQQIVAVSAIANNGTIYRPQLLLEVRNPAGETTQSFSPEVLRRLPVDPIYLDLIRQGMRRFVTQGYTDYGVTHSSIAIAGKSGTAEFGPFLRPGDRQTHAWFIGFAPYEDPELAVVVIIEGGGVGGYSALPPATDIIEYYFTRTTESQE